jgi:hypothetical protein
MNLAWEAVMVLYKRLSTTIVAALSSLAIMALAALATSTPAMAQHNSVTDELCGNTSSRYYNTCHGDWCAEYRSGAKPSFWYDSRGKADAARAGCTGSGQAASTGSGCGTVDPCGRAVVQNPCADPCGQRPKVVTWEQRMEAEGKKWWLWPLCAQNPRYRTEPPIQKEWDGCTPVGFGGARSTIPSY